MYRLLSAWRYHQQLFKITFLCPAIWSSRCLKQCRMWWNKLLEVMKLTDFLELDVKSVCEVISNKKKKNWKLRHLWALFSGWTIILINERDSLEVCFLHIDISPTSPIFLIERDVREKLLTNSLKYCNTYRVQHQRCNWSRKHQRLIQQHWGRY